MPGLRTSAYKNQPWRDYVSGVASEESEAVQLINAVRTGDRIALQNLLRSGADPNSAVDEFGATPMHVAAGCTVPCGAWILEEMMRVGGNPNISDAEGLTPVHLACIGQSVDCLRTLIEHGGDPSVKSADNYTALGYARKYGAFECVNFLLGYGAESRPALSTLNGGRKLQRENSGSSLNSLATQYHSACSSPVKLDRQPQQSAAWSRRKSATTFPAADFDSDAYVSPRVVRKSVIKRSTSGNREVPRRISQTRCSRIFSSDSEDEHVIPPSRSTSKTRASSLGRNGGKTDQWPAEEKPLSKPTVRVNSSNDLNVEGRGRGRRLSGKENETTKKDAETELLRQEYARFASVTDQEIRRQLRDLGTDPGPILTSAHRSAYINRLIVLKRCKVNGDASISVTVPRSAAFCKELKQVVTKTYDKEQMRLLERDFEAIFRGIPKTSFYFTYLLIDPQISQNLPHQVNQATEANIELCFKVFLRSIFYVGKGKDSRPMQHLVDAKRVFMNRSLKTSPKLDRICSIWDREHGVVCVRLFDHRGEEEAYSRESLMIEALGMERLTNKRGGTVHGPVSSWSGSRRRLLGSSFLLDAFHYLLAAGEQQIFPQDIRA